MLRWRFLCIPFLVAVDIPNQTIQWRYNFYMCVCVCFLFLLIFSFFENRLKRERFTVKIGARSIIIMEKKCPAKDNKSQSTIIITANTINRNNETRKKTTRKKEWNRSIKTIFQFRKCYVFCNIFWVYKNAFWRFFDGLNTYTHTRTTATVNRTTIYIYIYFEVNQRWNVWNARRSKHVICRSSGDNTQNLHNQSNKMMRERKKIRYR